MWEPLVQQNRYPVCDVPSSKHCACKCLEGSTVCLKNGAPCTGNWKHRKNRTLMGFSRFYLQAVWLYRPCRYFLDRSRLTTLTLNALKNEDNFRNNSFREFIEDSSFRKVLGELNGHKVALRGSVVFIVRKVLLKLPRTPMLLWVPLAQDLRELTFWCTHKGRNYRKLLNRLRPTNDSPFRGKNPLLEGSFRYHRSGNDYARH